jgi:pre-rRNA-processing protein TSR3
VVAVTVIRHPKEKIAKCSLRHLHERPGFTFWRAKPGFTFDATGFTLLAVDAPELSPRDAVQPLLLLDSTWRYLPQVAASVRGEPIRRSIPRGVVTAYPRKSRVFDDPEAGLASVEALYVALRLLGVRDDTLLDGYHWRTEFLAQAALQDLP